MNPTDRLSIVASVLGQIALNFWPALVFAVLLGFAFWAHGTIRERRRRFRHVPHFRLPRELQSVRFDKGGRR